MCRVLDKRLDHGLCLILSVTFTLMGVIIAMETWACRWGVSRLC